MGSSKFMTTKQAATLLGVSMRTLYRYVEKGLIEAKCEGRHLFINEEDVTRVKKGRRDMLSSPVKRDILYKLQAKVQELEATLSVVTRMLNITRNPLELTLPEADLLYKSAEQASIEGWPPHVEEQWAEYFMRLTVETFEKIELATNDPHPWRPFLRLAITMHLNPWDKRLEQMLGAGRNNVQQTAGIWCVLKGVSPRTFDVLQDRDAAPLKKLVRRLKKDQKDEDPDDN